MIVVDATDDCNPSQFVVSHHLAFTAFEDNARSLDEKAALMVT